MLKILPGKAYSDTKIKSGDKQKTLTQMARVLLMLFVNQITSMSQLASLVYSLSYPLYLSE